MKGGIGNIMKQAQEMQANMEKVKKEIAKTEVIGRSGGDAVRITMNGKHQVNRLEIDENVMKEKINYFPLGVGDLPDPEPFPLPD